MAKELLEVEESKLKGKTTTSAKVTRSEIAALQEKEAEKRKATKPMKKNVTVDDGPVEGNINHIIADHIGRRGWHGGSER